MIVPLGYSDPTAYLAQPNLHLSIPFTPTFAVSAPQRVSYATVGDPSATRTLVFLNGMAGHSLVAHIFDGVCRAAQPSPVKLITIDRPGAAHSSPCPVNLRVKWTFEALVAVLDHEGITNFTLFTHSNGILYGLYVLLNLPERFACTKWTLTSAYVPPWISSSIPLSIARYIPAPLTKNVGQMVKPVLATFGWSAGFSSGVVSWSSAMSPSSSSPPTVARPELEFRNAQAKQLKRPPHQRVASVPYYSSSAMDLCMDNVVAGGLTSVGDEALICFRKNGAKWHWPGEDKVEEGELYAKAFGELAERRKVEMKGWYGQDDALIPKKGRDYVKHLWMDLGLMKEDGWNEIQSAGHDALLGLEYVLREVIESA